LISKAAVQTVKGFFNVALRTLGAALDICPNDEDVKVAIKSVKERKVQKYKEDVAMAFGWGSA
jgi:hypothetical protein